MNTCKLLIFGCVAMVLTLGSSSATAERRYEYAPVLNPSIPNSVQLCGEKIDLTDTDMYERLDRELSALIYSHGSMLLTIKRANRYFPVMAPILKANGVPEDMLYLACIESYLDPNAVSPSKAAGLWQFIPSTAKSYGLEVNDYVDERYHTEKATEAACRFLLDSYRRYGNWENVAASYNAGAGRITSTLDAQGQTSAYKLFMNQQTSRYIFRLIAMKIIMDRPSRFGYTLRADQLYQPVEYDYVTVDTPVESWIKWADDHGISYRTLRVHNPWIRSESLPNKSGKSYRIAIPRKESRIRTSHNLNTFNHNWIH